MEELITGTAVVAICILIYKIFFEKKKPKADRFTPSRRSGDREQR